MRTASCLWPYFSSLLFTFTPLCQVSSQHHFQRPQWFHQSKRFHYHQLRKQLFHLESTTQPHGKACVDPSGQLAAGGDHHGLWNMARAGAEAQNPLPTPTKATPEGGDSDRAPICLCPGGGGGGPVPRWPALSGPHD